MSYVRIAGGVTAYEGREAIRQDTLLVSLSIGARLAPGAELAIGFRVPWSVARPLIEFAAPTARPQRVNESSRKRSESLPPPAPRWREWTKLSAYHSTAPRLLPPRASVGSSVGPSFIPVAGVEGEALVVQEHGGALR